ncbi:MAG TPA: hypothetical protein DCS66_16175, partial [Flavobacteriaceae bacterium]|nr:hypothetical protein [Flavobacteriaceae bacterium]
MPLGFQKNSTFMQNQKTMSSRRDFVKKSAILGAGITLAPQFTFAENFSPSKEKLNIALIGV